jgi:tetratricopeptide (TPR) repeat protein
MMFAAKAAGQWSSVRELAKQLRALSNAYDKSPLHTDEEFISIEADWQTRLEIGSALIRLLACARAANAEVRHRVDAACLLVKIAQERGDIDLATNAFKAVEAVLDPDSSNYSNRILPALYHAGFGDRNQALSFARKLVSELDSLESIGQQFRASCNLGTILCWLGVYEEAADICQNSYEKACSLGTTVWQHDLSAMVSMAYMMAEDFERAEPWYERCQSLHTEYDGGGHFERTYLSCGLERALWRRDMNHAQALLQATLDYPAESLRWMAYLRGTKVRVQQLDPHFDCDDETIVELRALFETTKGLTCTDGLAQAIAEALRRRGRLIEARQLLDQYASSARREGPLLPPSLAELIRDLS